MSAALRAYNRGSRKEERAHQLVTVQKQMCIPAQNSSVSVSNYFETVLHSNCLIPKASLSLPPASYLRCSLSAPLLLIINLSLQGECFGKHPPAVSGCCRRAMQGIRKQSPQSRTARQDVTAFAKTACGSGYSVVAAKALRNYHLNHTERKGGREDITSLIKPGYTRGYSLLGAICAWDIYERANDGFLYSSR